jgi:hypothetical protein
MLATPDVPFGREQVPPCASLWALVRYGVAVAPISIRAPNIGNRVEVATCSRIIVSGAPASAGAFAGIASPGAISSCALAPRTCSRTASIRL